MAVAAARPRPRHRYPVPCPRERSEHGHANEPWPGTSTHVRIGVEGCWAYGRMTRGADTASTWLGMAVAAARPRPWHSPGSAISTAVGHTEPRHAAAQRARRDAEDPGSATWPSDCS